MSIKTDETNFSVADLMGTNVLAYRKQTQPIINKANVADNLDDAAELMLKMIDFQIKRFKWLTAEQIRDNNLLGDEFSPLCIFINNNWEDGDKPCHIEGVPCPLEDYIGDGCCCEEHQNLLNELDVLIDNSKDVDNMTALSDKFFELLKMFKKRVQRI